MDINDYTLECCVRDRLARARADARAAHILRALTPVGRRRRPLRDVLGSALIALGQWVMDATPAPKGTHA